MPAQPSRHQSLTCRRCGHTQTGPLGTRCPNDALALLPPGALVRAASDVHLGRVIADRFALYDCIGVGGMGAVFHAIQLPVFRPVAVKIIHPSLGASVELQDRFFREAQAVARLNHPATVTLHDYGCEPDGLLYMVLEYLPGRTLTELIRAEAPLPPTRAVALLRQVLGGLSAAHELGLIHRDLKPDNLIVLDPQPGADDLHGERIKILDFGVAKMVGGDLGPEDQSATRTGAIVGTPLYIAPEQALARTVGPPADLYAAGVILYELLTGRPPFSGDSVLAVLNAQVIAPVPPLSAALGLPAALDAAIHRALAKDPADRFQDAAAMSAVLRDALGPLGSSARPRSLPPPTTALGVPPPPVALTPAYDPFAAPPPAPNASTPPGGDSTVADAPPVADPVADPDAAPPPGAVAPPLALPLAQPVAIARPPRAAQPERPAPRPLAQPVGAPPPHPPARSTSGEAPLGAKPENATLIRDFGGRPSFRPADLRLVLSQNLRRLTATPARAAVVLTAALLLVGVVLLTGTRTTDGAPANHPSEVNDTAFAVARSAADLETQESPEPDASPDAGSAPACAPHDRRAWPCPGGALTLRCRDGAWAPAGPCLLDATVCGPDTPAPPCNGCPSGVVVPAGWACLPPGELTLGDPRAPADPEARPAESPRAAHGPSPRDAGGLTARVAFTRPLLLQTTEITQAEWTRHHPDNPAAVRDCGPNCPVERITWSDLASYANARSRAEQLPTCYPEPPRPDQPPTDPDCPGYRLPTEAEWEYAARAADQPHPDLDDAAWTTENSQTRTHPVATRAPNAWGFYDLLGNVAEWTADWYAPQPYATGRTANVYQDPQGPHTGTYRVIRGGSWATPAAETSATHRAHTHPETKRSAIGGRLIRLAP